MQITLWYVTFLQSYNRCFPKVDHWGIDASIVLEQKNFSKKKKTSDRTWTPDPRIICGAQFFFPLKPYPCASPPLLGRLRL